MKKFIILSIIAGTLVNSSTSFSMLRVLRTQKRPYTRMCHTKKVFRLPNENIFTASPEKRRTDARTLLEDLYRRNENLETALNKHIELSQDIITILKSQSWSAFDHTFNGEDLNRQALEAHENQITEHLELLAKRSWAIYTLTHEKKFRGHADE